MKGPISWPLIRTNASTAPSEPECPVEAIYSEDEVPDDQAVFLEINADMAAKWPNITEKRMRRRMPMSGMVFPARNSISKRADQTALLPSGTAPHPCAECAFPPETPGQHPHGFLTIEHHMGGITPVMPVSKPFIVGLETGHHAQPAAGFQALIQELEGAGRIVQVLNHLGTGNEVVGVRQPLLIRDVKRIVAEGPKSGLIQHRNQRRSRSTAKVQPPAPGSRRGMSSSASLPRKRRYPGSSTSFRCWSYSAFSVDGRGR